MLLRLSCRLMYCVILLKTFPTAHLCQDFFFFFYLDDFKRQRLPPAVLSMGWLDDTGASPGPSGYKGPVSPFTAAHIHSRITPTPPLFDPHPQHLCSTLTTHPCTAFIVAGLHTPLFICVDFKTTNESSLKWMSCVGFPSLSHSLSQFVTKACQTCLLI